jgi:hypothetical protein
MAANIYLICTALETTKGWRVASTQNPSSDFQYKAWWINAGLKTRHIVVFYCTISTINLLSSGIKCPFIYFLFILFCNICSMLKSKCDSSNISVQRHSVNIKIGHFPNTLLENIFQLFCQKRQNFTAVFAFIFFLLGFPCICSHKF